MVSREEHRAEHGPIALGIDTGGTYTDAVLVDQSVGAVLTSAKALTTHSDLAIGISEAIAAILGPGMPVSVSEIGMVGLSTTLATNAIVEGHGSPVCLVLIGYDQEFIQKRGFEQALVTKDVLYVDGGHNAAGDEMAALDERAIRDAVRARQGRTAAYAVSGYFGVRNPSHELRARTLIQEAMGSTRENSIPVTCAHELTTRLNAVRRATTAALNASLIPLLQDLVATVRVTLDEARIRAPLMIVKGDGSLVRADWAMRRPIETILSGPAASVVGTWHLAGRGNVWVVDVGGTTTDIAALRDGRPRINPEGARVGGWRTMVEAADVHTVGLGGDSHVRLNGGSTPGFDGLSVGPRRVVPLSLLAMQFPSVVQELERQRQARDRMRLSGQFVVSHRRDGTSVSEADQALLDLVIEAPRSLLWLVDHLPHGRLVLRQIKDMARRQLVRYAAFTPTDALHVLGRFQAWDSTAAQLGAELLATQVGMSMPDFCQRVVAAVSDRVAAELVSKVLADEASTPDWEREPAARALLTRAMGGVIDSDLGCRLSLRQPVVAVGAPVEAYLPRAAKHLDTELIIPAHAEVANAVGAVAGSVVQIARALIRPMEAESYFRLHLSDGVHDFPSLQEAVAYAEEVVPPRVIDMARQAGADHIEVQIERDDRTTLLDVEWGQEVYLETLLTVKAMGRPAL